MMSGRASPLWMKPAEPPRLGISRCLLGEEVRFDGGHKRDPFLIHTFGRAVEWVPVCPELEVGMGVPREAIHLVASHDGVPAGTARVRLLGVRSGTDWTAAMARYGCDRSEALAGMHLSGFILKKDSPSCGMDRVRVKTLRAEVDDTGRSAPAVQASARTGRGLFAQALLGRLPNLPVEEEGRLHDPPLRANFVERVFASQRVRTFFAARWTIAGLVQFHTAHKLQLLAHSRAGYSELGRMVAGAKGRSRPELAAAYEALFTKTLARIATPGRHADVMMHMGGHLKRRIDAGDRDELLTAIEDHRRGLVPLAVPVTLLRHHVRRHAVEYLTGQTYLEPHPKELALRA
jgi:uncharacterized protein YbgA (DUF1722 family)/uncharacterized protein YbbK (DUF523 family)